MSRPRKGEIRRVTLTCRHCGVLFTKPLSQAGRPFHVDACYRAYWADPQRLWERVARSEDCWLHDGPGDDLGYVRLKWRGRALLAHRLAWELAAGEPPPANRRVCHTCDHPSCVRNDGELGTYEINGQILPRYGHLFLGTDADNNADKETKGRAGHPRGERHGLAKLSDEDVAQIVELYRSGSYTQKQIAAQFGITQGHVSKLTLGLYRT